MTEAKTDPRIVAIRADKNVGRGSCAMIDECMEDIEVLDALDKAQATTTEAALTWAYESEGLWREKGLNTSSGEPDCELKASHADWQEKTDA